MTTSSKAILLAAAIFLVPLTATASAAVTSFKFVFPAAAVAEAQGPTGAPIAYTVTATFDGHAGKVTCAPPSGTLFPLGWSPVSCSATYRDRKGQHNGKGAFPVLVRDTTPPVLQVPAATTVHTNQFAGTPSSSPAIATFLSQSTASDVVDGSDAVSSDAPSTFNFGERTITFTAVDKAGNVATATTSLRVVLDSARHLNAPEPGAIVSTPPTLSWAGVARAAFYNVQLYRGAHKVLTAWPARARLHVKSRWTYRGTTRQLRPGIYTWYVWPAFGAKTHVRYGKLLGASTFTVG
jgi:hypothetical protein